MPKKNNQNAQPNEPEIRADILAEEHDMEDELEENVGVPPRKVTMDEFVKADEEFNKLLASEEKEFERMPFRPGKNTKFVLTERQKDALKEGADEIEKYLKHDTRHSIEDNQRLQDLQNAMYRILEVGPDGLDPDEKKTVSEFNEIMDGKYNLETGDNKTLIRHMDNYKGPYDLKMRKIHRGLDMLGVLTGKPATYERNQTENQLKLRAEARKETVDQKMSKNPEEAKALVETAGRAGLQGLQETYKGTEIGEMLGKIGTIVKDLGDWKYGQHGIDAHLMEADGLGTFLNTKGQDGKTNYDKIAEAILAKKPGGADQKYEFDLLLGQLNTVCDLDINVPYAVEAKAEYDWNKTQQTGIDATRINDLNERLFSKNRTVNSYDTAFLDDVRTMTGMIETVCRNKLQLNTENYANMTGALFGFRKIENKVRNNSGFNKLGSDNDNYINVLGFGKLLEREQDGTTLYAMLAEAYEKKGKTKDDLNNTLKQLNEKLGLKIEIPGREIEGGKAKPAKVTQSKPYLRKIAEVQRSSNRIDDPVQLKMALASILALRRMSVDPAHKDHTKIRTKAAQAKAFALMNTDAFKALTAKMDVIDLAKKINHPGNFDKEFTQKLKALDEAKYAERLKDEKYRKKLQSIAKRSAHNMDKTGTGVYMLGIKRRSNSGMYDRAVLAMQRASAENVDAATTMQSVETVKEYLSNKMSRRSSPSGQERWQSCMEFLHEAMPPKEFEEYCKQVNRVRNAKEGSANYIEPDQFAPQKQRNSVPADPEKNVEVEVGPGRNSL